MLYSQLLAINCDLTDQHRFPLSWTTDTCSPRRRRDQKPPLKSDIPSFKSIIIFRRIQSSYIIYSSQDVEDSNSVSKATFQGTSPSDFDISGSSNQDPIISQTKWYFEIKPYLIVSAISSRSSPSSSTRDFRSINIHS